MPYLILILVYEISRDEIYLGKANWQRSPKRRKISLIFKVCIENNSLLSFFFLPSLPPGIPSSLLSSSEVEIWGLTSYLKGMREAEGPFRWWQFSLRRSLRVGFLYKEQSSGMRFKMLCPRLCYLGAFLDLCCLVLNQWGLNLSL